MTSDRCNRLCRLHYTRYAVLLRHKQWNRLYYLKWPSKITQGHRRLCSTIADWDQLSPGRLSTFGFRAFSVAAPAVSNSLPDSLRDPARLAATASDYHHHHHHHHHYHHQYRVTAGGCCVALTWPRRMARLKSSSGDWWTAGVPSNLVYPSRTSSQVGTRSMTNRQIDVPAKRYVRRNITLKTGNVSINLRCDRLPGFRPMA